MSKPSRVELRAEFMGQLLSLRAGSVQDAMLMCDAIVRYIESGEIANLSPGDAALQTRGRERHVARI